jgi:hypothetical protein
MFMPGATESWRPYARTIAAAREARSDPKERKHPQQRRSARLQFMTSLLTTV